MITCKEFLDESAPPPHLKNNAKCLPRNFSLVVALLQFYKPFHSLEVEQLQQRGWKDGFFVKSIYIRGFSSSSLIHVIVTFITAAIANAPNENLYDDCHHLYLCSKLQSIIFNYNKTYQKCKLMSLEMEVILIFFRLPEIKDA